MPHFLRVFLTGATGFIGHHLCRRLVERGDRVTALVRSPAKAEKLPQGVEVFPGDLSTLADPRTVLPPCDVVIHLAGVVAADAPEQYDAVNHRAVADFIACLERQSFRPRRFLLASSLAAAGPSPPGRAWTELDEPRPIELYGAAKAKAEVVLRSAPFATTAFRPPIVLGPGDEATLTLFKSARSGLGIRVAGPPQELSFIDVRDLVDAITLMAADERPGSYVYFASHPSVMNVVELWEKLGAALGNRVRVLPVPRWGLYGAMLAATGLSKVFRFKNQLDQKQYEQMVAPAFVCSSERLREELGFHARHELAEALENAVRGYREAGWL